MKKIHYISDDKKNTFIIAKTLCNIEWQKVNEFTSIKKYVTCKKCINKLK